MAADRAELGRLRALVHASADRADPADGLRLAVEQVLLQLRDEGAVALVVHPLDVAHHAEERGHAVKALVQRLALKARVHVRPLVVLAGLRVLEVFGRAAELAQGPVPELCVVVLVAGRLLKDLRNLDQPLAAGHLCVKIVLVPGHGLAGEGGHQVGLGSRTLEFHALYLLTGLPVFWSTRQNLCREWKFSREVWYNRTWEIVTAGAQLHT